MLRLSYVMPVKAQNEVKSRVWWLIVHALGLCGDTKQTVFNLIYKLILSLGCFIKDKLRIVAFA